MDRENIIRALEGCSSGMACATCAYCCVENCDTKLHEDAVNLLREQPKANENPKYTVACIYTKRTNLLDYFIKKQPMFNTTKEEYEKLRKYYAKEKDIELIAMFRWAEGKCFCKIKCPINPMPVKGEFEVVSYNDVGRFLSQNGWSFKEKLYPRIFQ